MTLIEQNNHSYWLTALFVGSILNLFLFAVLPALGSNEKMPEPKVITLDFIAWQEPVKQMPAEIPKPKKTPPKPRPKPKPEKPKPIAPPKPAPIQKPVLTDAIEPAQEQVQAEPIEEVVENDTQDNVPVPVPLFQVTTLPRVVHWQAPVYPTQMKALGREATVKIEILIDKQGKIRQAEVINSGGADFDIAALDSVRHSTFMPANVDGVAVAVRYRIPIRFRLN